MASFEIRHYLTADGEDVFLEWLRRVRDPIAKVQTVKRVNRVELGGFGDHKFCRDGVWELRIDRYWCRLPRVLRTDRATTRASVGRR